MHPKDSTEDLLVSFLSGDARVMERLSAVGDEQLLSAAAAMQPLVLRRAAALRVLLDLRSGVISDRQARAWGSAHPVGHLPTYDSPTYLEGQGVRPLEIDYDPPDHEAIAEVVHRIEKLGDLIDGTIEPHVMSRLMELVWTDS